MSWFSSPVRLVLTGAILAAAALAVETRVWNQSENTDFSRGNLEGLALRSDGHLTLGPRFTELDSTTVPYLWSAVRNRAGTVFYAGGAPTGASAKIFALPKGGKSRVLAEIPGLEIHALALDSQDRLYAAVLPDAKIYRIDSGGKAEVFFDTKCKYIWQMLFDGAGNLYVGTGDTGLIFRVSPDGKGARFFESEQTHVRSLGLDGKGNLIAGTEPSGLVVRITPAGESFVLYETGRREVTALAEQNGSVYAVSVGSKTAIPEVTGPAPVLPARPAPANAAGTPRVPTAAPNPAPAIGSFNANITGGSELDQIASDGSADRIWQSSSEIAYAVTFDGGGRPLLGTGNRGILYRIDSPQLATQIWNAPPSQITAFLQTPDCLYLTTGNVGSLYEMASPTGSEGTLTSDVLDARGFTDWGKAHITSDLHDGSLALETRSGNLESPDKFWSPWAAVPITSGGQVPSPPARFLQYRLRLVRGSSSRSGAATNAASIRGGPEVSSVDIAFQQRNVPPRVRLIEAAPLNYRQSTGTSLEQAVNAAGSPLTLTLPAVGQRRSSLPSASSLEASAAATLQYAKGFETLRWAASDPNEDAVEFRVEIKRTDTNHWILLKDKLTERFVSFDTAAFPDGEYTARVTASDAPGNVPGSGLTANSESDVFRIDNTAPEIREVAVSQGRAAFTVADALSWISKVEYSLDGGQWLPVNPVNKLNDATTLRYEIAVPVGRALSVRAFDESDNVVVKQLVP